MAYQSVFIAGKRKILHFYKNDTPSHPKITSKYTSFRSLSDAVFAWENFLDQQSVSIMPSKLFYGTVALQQSDLGCLKWFSSSYVEVHSQKQWFLRLLKSFETAQAQVRVFENKEPIRIENPLIGYYCRAKFVTIIFTILDEFYFLYGRLCSPLVCFKLTADGVSAFKNLHNANSLNEFLKDIRYDGRFPAQKVHDLFQYDGERRYNQARVLGLWGL